MVGNFLTSLIVVTLTNKTEFSTEEHKAYNILKQLSAEENLQAKAANVIRAAL